jgi:drug/metabolite transporter (DMT)-like permease
VGSSGLASAVIFLREGLTPGDAIGAVLIGSSVLYFVVADRRGTRADLSLEAASA